MGRFFGPGEVRLALISLLADGPQHGYELMKQLEARSGGMYKASAGTIYPTLQQLEDEELVTSTREGGKRVYRLTEAGEAIASEEESAIARIWRRADAWGDWGTTWDPEASELWRPVMRVVKSAFRAVARADYDPEVMDRVRDVLDRAVDDLREARRDGGREARRQEREERRHARDARREARRGSTPDTC